MAGIGIDGLISALDTTAIIEALLAVERRPIEAIGVRQTNDRNRITAFQNVNANLLALSVAASRLTNAAAFQQVQATSSQPSILGATATASAAEGTYALRVLELARAEQFASDSFASRTEALGFTGEFMVNGVAIQVDEDDSLNDIAAAINSVSGVNAGVVRLTDGDFRISVSAAATGAGQIDLREVGGGTVLADLGLVSGSTQVRNPITGGFQSADLVGRQNPVGTLLRLGSPPAGSFTLTDGNGNNVSVTVDFATDSLDDIAAAIQQAADDAGADLEAEVVAVDGGFRLQVTSAAGAEVVDDADGLLQTLGVLRPELKHQTEEQVGRDARFVVNGLELVRSSNIVTDAIPGVTLTLFSDDEPDRNVLVSVTTRTGDISGQIQGLVNAYNDTRSLIAQVTRYDAETGETGILLGNSALRGVERDLFSLLQTRVPRMLSQELGRLNGGAGVAPGSIRIVDRNDASGAGTVVDLTGARTVQDVVDRINRSAADVTASVEVRRVANPDFDPALPEGEDNQRLVTRGVLVLTDTSGGARSLRVEEVGGGRTAQDLGLLGTASGNSLIGASISAETGSISLVDVGVRLTDTGSLSFDSSLLAAEMSRDPAAVQSLFTAAGVGVGVQIQDRLSFITDPSRGTIATRIEGLRASIASGDETIQRIEDRLTQVEERLRRQFTLLETNLAELQRSGQFIEQQLLNLQNLNSQRGR